MKMTPKIQKAINRAAVLHAKQIRKAGEIPYITHLVSVAIILSNYTDDEDILVAGIMHDTLEDVPGYFLENLEEEFGPRVANIVKGVTEERGLKDSPWLEIKRKYIENLKKESPEALMVSAADKLHNLTSLVEGYHEHGESFLTKFGSPKNGGILWFYGEVLRVLQENLNNKIVDDLGQTYKHAQEVFGHK